MDSTDPSYSASAAATLPLKVVDRAEIAVQGGERPARQLRWIWWVSLLAAGAAAVVAWGGLTGVMGSGRGDGVSNQVLSVAPPVVALGRLIPTGDVRTLAPPFGAGDARVAEILVTEGQQVSGGTPLAVFDSALALEAILAVAEQQLASRRAGLAQAERAVSFSQAESAAALARAEVSARAAEVEYRRWAALVNDGFVAPAAADLRRAQRDEAAEERRRARANVARHAGEGAEQPDLLVARRAVDAAVAERDRAARDLARATLRAPGDGTVIAIHVQPGERPGSGGVMDFGDTRVMMAELEIYQADVARVAKGQRVTLHSPALAEPLTGNVSRIGLSVGRQRLTETSPASNIDARVVLATAVLDDTSSARARRLVGLEVQADIEASAP